MYFKTFAAAVLSLSSLAASISLNERSASNCCQSLSVALPGEVSYPDSVTYNASVLSYWSAQEENVAPYCIVQPASAQDVSTAVKILVAGTNGQSCQFAVRSGGHAYIPGDANIQGGVTIDLSKLNQVVPVLKDNYVVVGPGARWGAVYNTLDPFNVSVSGGRDAPVGVGGLTLGGGFGYNSYQVGFACDNVLGYQIVLADGSITYAVPDTKTADLFKALRGGSGNFGIVTYILYKTFPLNGVYGGDIYYPISTLPQQLQALYDFTANPNYDIYASNIQNFAYDPSVGSIITNEPVYAKPVVNPPALQPFTSIEPQLANDMSVSTYGAFTVKEGLQSPDGSQQITFAVTFTNSLEQLQKTFDAWNASIPAISGVSGIEWSLSLEPITPGLLAHSSFLGGNVLGLSAPPQGLILILLSGTYTDASDAGTVTAAAQSLLNNIIAAAKSTGTYNRYVDLNHAAKFQNPIASYGETNVAFLRTVSKKYDPKGIFQTVCPGGFKVFY